MKKKTYKCKQCEFTAKSKAGLANHMRIKHAEKEVSLHQPFDLNITNEKQAQELIAYLQILENTAGWQILKQIFDGNIAMLEKGIITKLDPETNTMLDEKQVDELRFKRNYLDEIIAKPKQLIELFEKQQGVETPTYDPYATDIRQFNPESKVGAPRAGTLKT